MWVFTNTSEIEWCRLTPWRLCPLLLEGTVGVSVVLAVLAVLASVFSVRVVGVLLGLVYSSRLLKSVSRLFPFLCPENSRARRERGLCVSVRFGSMGG